MVSRGSLFPSERFGLSILLLAGEIRGRGKDWYVDSDGKLSISNFWSY